MIATIAGVAAASVSGLVLAHGGAWTVLSLVALPRPRATRRDGTGATGPLRMAVIVPAHNEELLLGACLDSLLADVHSPRPEIIVVADNCSDGTAGIARARRVTVLERADRAERGKSYALEHALAHLRTCTAPPDAVVVIDADTTVGPGFLRAMADRLSGGAEAVQAYYQAAPEGEVAALRRLALMLLHYARPLGASRLGLGTGLKGNGMALRWAVVRDGLGGAGITEDAAMTVDLAGRGVRVAFAPLATVLGHMAATYGGAAVQDRRWEAGRLSLAGRALASGVRALRRGDVACAAAAFEVASLPLSLLVALAGAGAALGLVGIGPLWLALAAPASLVTYAGTGWAAARATRRDLRALAAAPRFLVHKASVYAGIAAGRGPAEWQRTGRG